MSNATSVSEILSGVGATLELLRTSAMIIAVMSHNAIEDRLEFKRKKKEFTDLYEKHFGRKK